MRIGENEKRLTRPAFAYQAYDDSANIGKAATTQRKQTQSVETTKPSAAVTTQPGTNGRTGAGEGAGMAMIGNNQPYIDQLNSLYDQVMGRGKFQYDLNGDMLYRQMADQYTQLGRQAMRDSTGTAAALTGGYGNSYANQVGNQAYQQYLTQLNSQIPNLYDRAYTAWRNEGDDLMWQYQMALTHPGNVGSLMPQTTGGAVTAATETTGDNTGNYWQSVVDAALNRGNLAKTAAQSVFDAATSGLTTSNPLADFYNKILKEVTKK